MATGLKLLGLFLCIAMATGNQNMMDSLNNLAEIQRDLYLKTYELFNSSVSNKMVKMFDQLRDLEARVEDVEGRLEDYAARTGNNNEVPVHAVPVPDEPEPEPVAVTTTTKKPYTGDAIISVEPHNDSNNNGTRPFAPVAGEGTGDALVFTRPPAPSIPPAPVTRKETGHAGDALVFTMPPVPTRPPAPVTRKEIGVDDTILSVTIPHAPVTRKEIAVDDIFLDVTMPTPPVNMRRTTEPRRSKTTTTTRAPTTRSTTTRRTTTTLPPTTTTLPPTTTTMPTTTATTTMPPTTTPIPTTPMPTPVTCAELAQRGETESGTFLIDPTRSGNAFYAECELPQGVTTIGHSAVSREVHNNNNEDPASFRLNPMYDATIDQMKALTAASQNCSQFIKYRCKGAVLLAADKKSGLQYGYWVSVDGEQIVSWGGAPVNSYKCACATTAAGCMGSKPCNCDSNPKKFATDEGLITDKPYLPVTDVYLGDTGAKKEEGYLTLGPLRCQ